MELNVEKFISDAVSCYMEEVDLKESFDTAIKQLIRAEISQRLAHWVKEEAQLQIKAQVQSILHEFPTEINDGFGRKEKYESFDDLFKVEIMKRLNSSWDMKNLLKRTIEEHVATLFNQHLKNVNQYIVDKILEKENQRKE